MDASLGQHILQGDPTAEDELVRRFRGPVFVMALVRTRDAEAARDLAQEVLLQVIQALREGRLRNEESLAAYVHGTARNLVNNYFRSRRSRELPEPGPDPPAQAPDNSEDLLELADRRRFVHRALERLNAGERAVLQLTLAEGLPPAEIARRLGLKPEAVRQRKSRAMKKIRKMLAAWSRTAGPGHY
jgi:RNA polymerase sigma factor (sigma-70 family)